MNSAEGHIFFEYGLPADNIDVKLYNRGFGGTETLLGEGKTDDQGYYKVSYELDSKSPTTLDRALHLEVRTVDANGKEISLSETKFNAGKHEVLNLVAPKSIRPLTDEYSQLVADLEKQLNSNIKKLAEAQEKDERHDLSVLHHATSWDARLISILAKATKLSEETGIPQEVLYALLRVGLPSEKGMLANVDILVVEKALNKAKKAGIITLDDHDDLSIKKAKKAFEKFAHSTLLEAKAPGALSTTAELLDKSILSEQNNNEKSTFENLYLSHRGSPEELWRKAREKGIPEQKIEGLRLQGKLAYLTLNNAPLVHKLQEEIRSPDNLSRLVGLGLHDEKSWKDLLNSMAGGGREQALAKIIPPGYEGKRVNDRLDAYSADLARKVRLSFPTKVVAQMIKKGQLEFSSKNNSSDDNNKKGDNKDDVVAFLNNAEGLGFQLGRVPIDAFVQNNKEHLFPPDTPQEKIEVTKENIKKLQRLYQITPSNESLNILLKQGFSSASDIVAFSKQDFLKSFGHLFSSLEEADLVYRKSQQVSIVTNNVLTTARLMESTPAVYAISPSAEILQQSRNELIKHYPSLESLLGSPDFCECGHCQSVLSPAAYFVDLLKFLEPDDNVWVQGFLVNWRNKHNEEEYMKDWLVEEGKLKKPYYALIERRPDLPHLPLTCENTNIVLPYIDLVNEILEYYVVYSSLNNYRGDTDNDVGDDHTTKTPELLAEPQNILPEAYNKLKEARYPLSLPFDLWLETIRMFFNHFEIPLWKVLDVFRLAEELFWPAIENPTNSTNATVTIPYSDAVSFKVGNAVTYRRVSTGQIHNETKIISSIREAGSVSGKAIITLSGTWVTHPSPGDLLILADRTYSWANIFSEYLEISPAEYAIFTDANPLEKWEELYGYTTVKPPIIEISTNEGNANVIVPNIGVTLFNVGDVVTYYDVSANALHMNETKTISNIEIFPDSIPGGLGRLSIDFVGQWTMPPEEGDLLVLIAPAALRSAKTLARQLGISYKELTQIVETGFVNPELDNLVLVRKLRLNVTDVVRYFNKRNTPGYEQEKQAFEAHLSEFDTAYNLPKNSSLISLESLWTEGVFKRTLVLQNKSSLCNFDETYFEFAGVAPESQPVEKAEQYANLRLAFLKINLFVRLWRKLGWTIEETDQVIRVFLPGARHRHTTLRSGITSTKVGGAEAAILSHPHSDYNTIPGTRWISDVPDGMGAENSVVTYTTEFQLPQGFLNANIQLRIHADDAATAYLNGQQIGQQAQQENPENFRDPTSDYRANSPFKQGINVLRIDVKNFRSPEGLDYEAVLAYTPNLGAALATALVYIAHLKEISKRVNIGKNNLIKLLTLWSDISTRGRSPLYDQLFLTRSMQNTAAVADPIFDDPLGNYLSRPGILLKNHLLSLQAALNLTADEIKQILKDAQKNLDSEPLTLAIVSLLYRYGLLAKGLNISMHELISLKQLSGLDPFEAIESSPITSINQDHPFKQTLEFIKIVEKINESGFKVEDLNYLLRHKFDDPLGKYRSKSEAAPPLIQRLAAEISRIQAENKLITDAVLEEKLTTTPDLPSGSIPRDFVKPLRRLASVPYITDVDLRELIDAHLPSPSNDNFFKLIKNLIADLRSEYVSITDDTIRQKLSLVLPSDVVDRFFGFWKDTVEFSVKKEQVEQDRKLDPFRYQVDGIRVSYVPDPGPNPTGKGQQHVIHIGVLTNEKKINIINKIPIPNPIEFPKPDILQKKMDAYNNFIDLLARIAIESGPQPRAFFDRYFEGFLNYDDLYYFPSESESLKEELIEEARRHKLLGSILPFIQQRLIRQLVIQTLATNLNAEPKLTEMLISDACFLTNPLGQDEPLLDVFAAVGDNGVNISFFNNNGDPISSIRNVVDTVDTAAKVDDVPVKPPEAKSARFDGYFGVPTTGTYNFFLVFSRRDTEARFRLYHMPEALITGKATTDDGEEIQQSTELETGVLYRFSIDIDSLGNNGDVSLLVQGGNLPKGSLSQLTLYPHTVVEQSIRAYVLLAKALQVVQGLGLSQREIRYILHAKCEPPGSIAQESDFSDVDLSKLPTIENDDSAAVVGDPIELFKQFILLVDYTRLKHDLSSGTDDLIAIFENASKSYPEITNAEEAKLAHLKPLANLTRRNVESLRAVAERMGLAIIATPISGNNNNSTDADGYHVEIQGIASVEKFWRVWKALQVVEKLGVPIEKILAWATPTPDYSIAQDIRNSVKSRYERENWLAIAPSIFDKLRQRKRDSLVAYIMHNGGFERMEQLFEYFLIDPGMEPIVQTSRLRLAISSVQLFIQRCLLNLEKKVHPSAIIDSHQWQWMKRYRVWEANKKIFLFPENWLEPEFRDDKSYLFQEVEGALMQGDVSNDLVENAFYNYLKKLQELANLDIITMYCEKNENSSGDAAAFSANTVLHVIGRTPSLPHKYFYRRYANQIWTPWEPVTAEIQGDHVVVVTWRGRLQLFWVKFLEKGKPVVTKKSEGATVNMTFADLPDQEISKGVTKQVEIQLNWCEYYQGQWTTPQSTDVGNSIILDYVNELFTPNHVFIHVSKYYEEGHTALKINIRVPPEFLQRPDEMLPPDSPKTTFKILSKHSPPIIVAQENLEFPPYNIDMSKPTLPPYNPEDIGPTKLYSGTLDHLQILFAEEGWDLDTFIIEQELWDRELDTVHHPFYSLLFSSNISDIVRSPDLEKYRTPFFYQDRLNTFFVQPKLTETTIQEWEPWIINHAQSKASLNVDDINEVPIEISIPEMRQPGGPMPPSSSLYHPIDPLARYKIKDKKDWLTDPSIVLLFDQRLIGSDGGLDVKVKEVLPAFDDSINKSHRLLDVKQGSKLTPDSSSLRMIVAASAKDYVHSVIRGGGGSRYGDSSSSIVSNDLQKLHAGHPLPFDIGSLKVIDSRGMNSSVLRSLNREKVRTSEGGVSSR